MNKGTELFAYCLSLGLTWYPNTQHNNFVHNASTGTWLLNFVNWKVTTDITEVFAKYLQWKCACNEE